MRLYRLIFIIDHINNYTKFLMNLTNVDEMIGNKDKAALISLSYLWDLKSLFLL